MYIITQKLDERNTLALEGALSRYCTITLESLKLPMHQWKP